MQQCQGKFWDLNFKLLLQVHCSFKREIVQHLKCKYTQEKYFACLLAHITIALKCLIAYERKRA